MTDSIDLTDDQLLRYSRQILLNEVGIDGQEKLLQSSVAIIGLGGLGSPASLYLAAAGVGTLHLVDPDTVDISNLQRQIIHDTTAIDLPKVSSAQQSMQTLNPDVSTVLYPKALDTKAMRALFETMDIVLDCTDNLEARKQINRISFETSTPLVSAAAVRFEGQIGVYNQTPVAPCYECFYGNIHHISGNCAENGVIGPLLGVIGSMQALTAIKLLTQKGIISDNIPVALFDAWQQDWIHINIPKQPDCSVCG